MIVKNRKYKDIKKSKKKTRLVPYSYTLKETQKKKIKRKNYNKNNKNSNNQKGKSRSKNRNRSKDKSKSRSSEESRNSAKKSENKSISSKDNQIGGFLGLFKNLFKDPKVRKFLSYKKAITKYYETKLKPKIEKLKPLQRKFELISNKLTVDNQALFLLVKMKVIYDKRAAEEIRNNNNISKKFNILEDKVIKNKKEILEQRINEFEKSGSRVIKKFTTKIEPYQKYVMNYSKKLDKLMKLYKDSTQLLSKIELSRAEADVDEKKKKKFEKLMARSGKITQLNDDLLTELSKPVQIMAELMIDINNFKKHIEKIKESKQKNIDLYQQAKESAENIFDTLNNFTSTGGIKDIKDKINTISTQLDLIISQYQSPNDQDILSKVVPDFQRLKNIIDDSLYKHNIIITNIGNIKTELMRGFDSAKLLDDVNTLIRANSSSIHNLRFVKHYLNIYRKSNGWRGRLGINSFAGGNKITKSIQKVNNNQCSNVSIQSGGNVDFKNPETDIDTFFNEFDIPSPTNSDYSEEIDKLKKKLDIYLHDKIEPVRDHNKNSIDINKLNAFLFTGQNMNTNIGYFWLQKESSDEAIYKHSEYNYSISIIKGVFSSSILLKTKNDNVYIFYPKMTDNTNPNVLFHVIDLTTGSSIAETKKPYLEKSDYQNRNLYFLDPITSLPYMTYGTGNEAKDIFKQTIFLFCDKAIELYFKNPRETLGPVEKKNFDDNIGQCLMSTFYPTNKTGQYLDNVSTSIYSLLFNYNTLDANNKLFQHYILQRTQAHLSKVPTQKIGLEKLEIITKSIEANINLEPDTKYNNIIITIEIMNDEITNLDNLFLVINQQINQNKKPAKFEIFKLMKEEEIQPYRLENNQNKVTYLHPISKIGTYYYDLKIIYGLGLPIDKNASNIYKTKEYNQTIKIESLPQGVGSMSTGSISSEAVQELQKEESREKRETLQYYLENKYSGTEYENIITSISEKEETIQKLIEDLVNIMKASKTGGGSKKYRKNKKKYLSNELGKLSNSDKVSISKNSLKLKGGHKNYDSAYTSDYDSNSGSESDFDYKTFTKIKKKQKGGNSNSIEAKLVKIGHYFRKLVEVESDVQAYTLNTKKAKFELIVNIWNLETQLYQKDIRETSNAEVIQLKNNLDSVSLTSNFGSSYININELSKVQSVEDKLKDFLQFKLNESDKGSCVLDNDIYKDVKSYLETNTNNVLNRFEAWDDSKISDEDKKDFQKYQTLKLRNDPGRLGVLLKQCEGKMQFPTNLLPIVGLIKARPTFKSSNNKKDGKKGQAQGKGKGKRDNQNGDTGQNLATNSSSSNA